jgi:hypothetical protein
VMLFIKTDSLRSQQRYAPEMEYLGTLKSQSLTTHSS